MIELIAIGILGVTNVALLAGLYYLNKEMTKERAKYVNALIAKNAFEMKDLELTDKVDTIEVPEVPEMTSLSDLDDAEFSKAVLGDEDGFS